MCKIISYPLTHNLKSNCKFTLNGSTALSKTLAGLILLLLLLKLKQPNNPEELVFETSEILSLISFFSLIIAYFCSWIALATPKYKGTTPSALTKLI